MSVVVERGPGETVGEVAEKVFHELEERHHFRLPRTAPSDLLEAVVLKVNYVAAFLWALLVLVVVFAVTLRYVFGRGSIMLEEIQWHIYGIGFILALSYALVTDRHVRIDVFAERLPVRSRGWIELAGLLFLLIPFCLAVILEAIPFVSRSWRFNEVSAAPGGLPYRWIPKSFILWGFTLLLLAAIARLLRVTALLFGRPRPKPAS
ncbi:MAG: TRAP transporter small permease subunit [Geminicoccaceae bacterium]|nr:TRAP transporter small permease subunit [Geminicoccaceae bacterium]MDW8125484.1 TRAP transporter small permease subunit [Geminicoccaceae bacterium]MDW8342320.1 TRAP transporter small permease subunit [Geminicoccaceae bacterium]